MEYTQEHLDRGGERLGFQVYPRPDRADPPALVIWPAMGVPARFYRPFAAELTRAGFAVYAVDLRGTGTSVPRPGRASRYGYPELAADVGAVQDLLRSRLGGRPPLLVGHSLGAHACLGHLARTGGADVPGLVVVAASLAYWRTYPLGRGLLTLAQTQVVAATATLLGYWPGWGFGGRQARGVVGDWAYAARRARYRFPAVPDPDAALAEVRTPVLAVSVDGDAYVPEASLDHLCGKLPNAPVERVRYTAAEAGAALNHFTWVRHAGPLARRIAAFAEGR